MRSFLQRFCLFEVFCFLPNSFSPIGRLVLRKSGIKYLSFPLYLLKCLILPLHRKRLGSERPSENQVIHKIEITLFRWSRRQCKIEFQQRTDDSRISPCLKHANKMDDSVNPVLNRASTTVVKT